MTDTPNTPLSPEQMAVVEAAARALEEAGYVIVPREATPAMIEAVRADRRAQKDGSFNLGQRSIADDWRAMIEARPLHDRA